jgi:hypothetical protein
MFFFKKSANDVEAMRLNITRAGGMLLYFAAIRIAFEISKRRVAK